MPDRDTPTIKAARLIVEYEPMLNAAIDNALAELEKPDPTDIELPDLEVVADYSDQLAALQIGEDTDVPVALAIAFGRVEALMTTLVQTVETLKARHDYVNSTLSRPHQAGSRYH